MTDFFSAHTHTFLLLYRYNIVRMISAATQAFAYTACVSLLQPPPTVMGLFDEVLLLREGHLIYQGPVDDVEEYMTELGYPRPLDIDTADFLIQVRQSSPSSSLLTFEWEPPYIPFCFLLSFLFPIR